MSVIVGFVLVYVGSCRCSVDFEEYSTFSLTFCMRCVQVVYVVFYCVYCLVDINAVHSLSMHIVDQSVRG